jgi:tRNA A37 threonylcarbamoyladenosine dehydratase
MSNSPRDDIIKAILTNNNLTEDEKSKIIGEFMDEFKNTYPNLEHHATKQDVSELELKLIKEIESVRKETKVDNLETKVDNLEVGQKEINRRLDNLEDRFDNLETKVEIIKWVAGMMLAQVFAIGGLVAAVFKIFSH